MIIDSRNEFCDATALNTGVAGTYLIGSQIDTGAADIMGGGDLPYFVVTVDTLPTSSGSTATLTVKIASDDSASISTTTSTVHYVSKTFAISEMAAGTVLVAIELPMLPAYERYIGVLQVTGTEAFTGGKINAFLTSDARYLKAYNDGI